MTLLVGVSEIGKVNVLVEIDEVFLSRVLEDWIGMAGRRADMPGCLGDVSLYQSDVPSGFTPYGLLTINVGVLATGLAASLRQPELEPVVANIEFNRLLRQQLAAENATRTSGNAALRRQVVLTITPVGQENR